MTQCGTGSAFAVKAKEVTGTVPVNLSQPTVAE